MLSRLRYYLASIPTLIEGIQNWLACAALPFRRTPLTIFLRNGLQFKVKTLMDVWIIKETCLDRDYETYGAPIQDGWTVIDIGAAAGDFAILTAREHPTACILAYEPSPASFASLQENIHLNEIKNILAFPVAVASTSGVLDLSISGAAVQHSTTQVRTANTVQVHAITLEEVFQTHTLDGCQFLKMDCEGGEFDILLNTSPKILACIDRICLEYHDGFTPFSHTDLEKHLQQNGYRVKITPNPAHNYLGFLFAYR